MQSFKTRRIYTVALVVLGGIVLFVLTMLLRGEEPPETMAKNAGVVDLKELPAREIGVFLGTSANAFGREVPEGNFAFLAMHGSVALITISPNDEITIAQGYTCESALLEIAHAFPVAPSE